MFILRTPRRPSSLQGCLPCAWIGFMRERCMSISITSSPEMALNQWPDMDQDSWRSNWDGQDMKEGATIHSWLYCLSNISGITTHLSMKLSKMAPRNESQISFMYGYKDERFMVCIPQCEDLGFARRVTWCHLRAILTDYSVKSILMRIATKSAGCRRQLASKGRLLPSIWDFELIVLTSKICGTNFLDFWAWVRASCTLSTVSLEYVCKL